MKSIFKEKLKTIPHIPATISSNENKLSNSYLRSGFNNALHPGHINDVESLFKAADTALYRVKDNGRSGYELACIEA